MAILNRLQLSYELPFNSLEQKMFFKLLVY